MGHDAASIINARVGLVQVLFSRPLRLESSWKSPAFPRPSTFVRSTLEERTSPGASTYIPLSPFRVFHFSGFLVCMRSGCTLPRSSSPSRPVCRFGVQSFWGQLVFRCIPDCSYRAPAGCTMFEVFFVPFEIRLGAVLSVPRHLTVGPHTVLLTDSDSRGLSIVRS